MTPKISIGFPVYNVAPFVERSLLSALNQNFEQPYEILVVDDCGTDNSMDIIHKIANIHPKGDCIRIIRHTHNKGLGEASNTIIEYANGDWLLFLDSDDRLTPDCLQLLYEKTHNETVDFVIGNTEMVDDISGDSYNYGAFTSQVIKHESAAAHMLFTRMDSPGYERWNKLYRVSFLRDNHIRCIHRIMEDMFFSFNTYLLSQCIATVNKTTYLYNNTPRESIMKDNLGNGLPQATLDIYISLVNAMSEKIKSEYSKKKYIYDLYFYFIGSICTALTRTGRVPSNLQYIAEKTNGFAMIVPNMHHLNSKTPRLFYLMSNKSSASIVDYMHWVDKTNNIIWRMLRWILSKI